MSILTLIIFKTPVDQIVASVLSGVAAAAEPPA
jgi:hypothetical protein